MGKYRIGMSRNKKGFTIIEVVLVLAIGGLIFLMVFIALPALQRSQRNTQRRSDVDRVASAIIDYQKHNKGNLPFSNYNFDQKFATRYIDSNCVYDGRNNSSPAVGGTYVYVNCKEGFTDPDGSPYTIGVARGRNQFPFISDEQKWGDNHTIYVANESKCDSSKEDGTIYTGHERDFVVVYMLEGGSVYCKDNS